MDSPLERLQERCDVTVHENEFGIPRDELLQVVAGRDALITMLTEKVDAELLEAAGPQLKIVANFAVGFDNIDVPACTDAGACGLAQKYYIQSARLAAESGDYRLQARTLRAMALQCVELGPPTHGRDIAEAAVRSLPASTPPRLRSWCTAMSAEASAAAGDPRTARTLLRTAERDLERATSAQSPDWSGSSYSHAALRHQTGTTLANAGDLAPAEEHLAASLPGRPSNQRRSRALIGTRLAALQVRRHRPDIAALTVKSMLDDLTMVESARVNHELERLRTDWSAARADPTVNETDQAIARLLHRRKHRSV
jgi:hypothetical protein